MTANEDVLKGLRVEPAATDEMPVIANLMQLYIYDFEPFIAGHTESRILPDGRYAGPTKLAAHWSEAGRLPYLFRVHGVVAGFALVNRHFKSSAPCDWAISEFFVHRRFRRHGIGQAAAHQLFASNPGRWEVAIMRANVPAHAFWQKAAETYSGVGKVVIHQSSGDNWNGPIMRFTAQMQKR